MGESGARRQHILHEKGVGGDEGYCLLQEDPGSGLLETCTMRPFKTLKSEALLGNFGPSWAWVCAPDRSMGLASL